MAKSKHKNDIVPGARFGKVTVDKYLHSGKKGKVWLCRCDCGNEVNFNTGELHGYKNPSCGCYLNRLRLGHDYGIYTVLDLTKHRVEGDVDAYYKVRCICGNEVMRRKKNITPGQSQHKSCRCNGTLSEQISKGDVYGYFTVIGTTIRKVTTINNRGDTVNKRYIKCRCKCGTVKEVKIDYLLRGTVKSCGCYVKEARLKRIKHGLAGTRIYAIWKGMMERCYNSDSSGYARYGGRGITVADCLHDVKSFVAIMGPTYKNGLSLDRIDNNGNYEPGNLQWTTAKEQNNNRNSSTRVTDVFVGDIVSISQLAERYGLTYASLIGRYHSGKEGIDLLNTANSYYNREWPFLGEERQKEIIEYIDTNTVNESAIMFGISTLDVLVIKHYNSNTSVTPTITPGTTYGVFTIIDGIPITKSNSPYPHYKVRCICGSESERSLWGLNKRPVNKCKCNPHKDKLYKGAIFGNYTIISDEPYSRKTSNGYSAHYVMCRCICGIEKRVTVSALITGNSVSCGCSSIEYRLAQCRNGVDTIKPQHLPLYYTWIGIMARCYNTKSLPYKRYGGRGIKLAEVWHDIYKFHDDLLPTYAIGLSLDRIDADGDYEPGNVRWATHKQQNFNKSDMLRVIDPFTDESICIAELAYRYGIKAPTLHYRYRKGKRGIDLLLISRGFYCSKFTKFNDTKRDEYLKTIRDNSNEEAAKLLGISLLDVLIIKHLNC